MAGTDSQKQLLTLIREVASKKSQEERRVVGLKKRIEELRSELEASNLELEDAKRLKEMTEQEIKGFEVELASNEALIQALEARIGKSQEHISAVGSEVDMLKTDEAALRNQFISQMFDLNSKIRKFQKTLVCHFEKGSKVGQIKEPGLEENFPEVSHGDLESMLAQVVSQVAKEEEECLAEKKNQEQESKSLEDLTRQTSELERTIASLCGKLQQRWICPRCHLNNAESLGEFFNLMRHIKSYPSTR